MGYLMNNKIQRIFQGFTVDGKLIPVKFLFYHGSELDYITYRQVDANNSLSGDDSLLGYADYYDFDFYCHKDGNFKGNYEAMIENASNLLITNDFVFQPSRSSPDMYETDTGYYHKTVCYGILREE